MLHFLLVNDALQLTCLFHLNLSLLAARANTRLVQFHPHAYRLDFLILTVRLMYYLGGCNDPITNYRWLFQLSVLA